MREKRGAAGLLVVYAAIFVWLMTVAVWYRPASVLDLTDNTNMLIALWWTVVCGICVFVGLQIEKSRAEQ